MKLGISSYTFGWAVGVRGYQAAHPLDESGLLDKAGELGVSLLQIGDNLPLIDFDTARIEKLAARAERENVALEIGSRRLTRDNLAAHIALSRRLKAKLLRFVVDDFDYHPAPPEIIALLREAVPLLRDNDVVLGIENHDRFPARTLRDIIEAAGSEQIGVCLDTANSLGAGEGIGEVGATLAPVTVNLHIKDFLIERVPHQMGFIVSGRPAGEGMMNLPAVLEQLAPFGRCHSAVVELWTPPQPRLEDTVEKEAAWAHASFAYLKRYF